MSGGRKLTPREQRAWRAVSRRVKPIAEPFDPDIPADAAAPFPSPAGTTRKPVPFHPPEDLSMLDALQAKARPAPFDRGNDRRIRRGQAPIHARFDLHGHTQASGMAALLDFVYRERHSGARCVLVITGKGRDGEGVLRRRFLDWIDSPAARQHVSGWSQAHAKHGGGGAFYLFLRRLPTGAEPR